MFLEAKSYAAVGRYYVVNENTTRYIKKSEVTIRTTVTDYERFSPEDIQHDAVNNAGKLAKVLVGEGFDITQDAHSETLIDEDLLELTKSGSEGEEEAPDPEEEKDEVGLVIEHLSVLLKTVKELQVKAEAWDPCMIRSLQFKNAIDAAKQIYKTLLTTMKKQRQKPLITMFRKPTKKALHENMTFSKRHEEEASPEVLKMFFAVQILPLLFSS
ncbi:Hypothetical predicted protein [Octopus vulgaris]|uniref:Uncharacterized protein n=1 Tax=Octopus vulgaris TaxID=6645 RepID=A0AA36ATI4_OCTVU|nr:Hypothetical predicted protein [Octopus vulgaris]